MTKDNDFKKVSSRFKFLLVFMIASLLGNFTYAQQKISVSGKVTNSETSTPLANVSVMVKGSSNEVVTDISGNYAISVPVGAILQFAYLASAPQEVKVKEAGTINISLDITAKNLQEVVVVGYGSRKKKDITGAISSIGAKDLEQSTAMTAEMALQGKAAGVFIESGGGAPSARPIIRIRGVNTFGFAEPLYVIDGLPIVEGGSNSVDPAIQDTRSPLNIFTLINPNDIESMSVLKDASAAAIYGVRAANGVILITTKKGKIGAPKVEFNASYGIQNLPKSLATINTQEYFSLIREAYAANPDAGTSFEQKFGDRYDSSKPLLYQGNAATYNWQDELKRKNAGIQDYSVKVSGGTESTNYYFSTGYAKTESPLKGSDLERYSTAFNIETKISKYIKSGLNLRLAQQNSLDNTQADLGQMATTVPFQPIYDLNDPTGFSRSSSAVFEKNPDFDPGLLNPGPLFNFVEGSQAAIWGPQTRTNVFAFQQLNSTKYKLFNTLGNAFLQIEPIKNLKIKGTVGGDYRTNLRKQFNSFEAWRFNQTPENPYAIHDGNGAGRYAERTGTTFNFNRELTVNYNAIIAKKHSFDILLGVSNQLTQFKWNDIAGNVNYANPQYWAVISQKGYSNGQGGLLEEDVLHGYFARLGYKFNDKYYLDGTVRRDGSSRVAPGKKFETFPSFGAGWRISAEEFFPKKSFVDDLKIRGGWGKLGNYQSARFYQYNPNISFSPDYPLGSGSGNGTGNPVPGSSSPNFKNPNLTWEKVETSSIGFDAVLFKSHVNFTAEYYNKLTTDIIQDVNLSPSSGIQQAVSLNVGSVRNRGFEFQLGYNNKFGDVGFNANANFTTVNNKVLKLNNGTAIAIAAGRVEEGQPIGYLYGYKAVGIFQNQAEIDAWVTKHSGGDVNIGANTYKPGDMYFEDVNGQPIVGTSNFVSGADGTINDNDRTFIGNSIAGYYYGLNLNADYKGFDMTVFLQGVGDIDKYNARRSGLEGMGGLAGQSTTTLNRWTPTNPSTTVPRAIAGDPYGANRFSSRFVENAAYLRLKTVQLGYTIPTSAFGKSNFVQRIRLYASGINLFTATKYTGLDPENDFFPVTKQFVFGLNASF